MTVTATDGDGPARVDRAVLLAALHNVDHPPRFLSGPIANAAAQTAKTLRIVLVSPLFDVRSASATNSRPTALGTEKFEEVQRLLTYVYVQATKVAQDMGKILMDVDVLLKGEDGSLQESATADAQLVYKGASPVARRALNVLNAPRSARLRAQADVAL